MIRTLVLMATLTLFTHIGWAEGVSQEWKSDLYFNSTSCFDTTRGRQPSNAALVIQSVVTRYVTKDYDQDISVASLQLVSDYAIASLLVNRGNLCLAQALDLKKVEEELLEEQQLLLTGTSLSKKEVKRHRKIAKNASKKIAEYANSIDEISPEKKKYFRSGAITYMLGVVQTVRLKQSFDTVISAAEKTTSTDIIGNSVNTVKNTYKKFEGLIIGGAGVLKVLNGIPSHIKKLVTSGNDMVKYAKKYEVDIGQDVTDEYSSILGFEETKKEKKSPFSRIKKAVFKEPEG